MSEISAAIGFNLIVISPTIALVGTALVLLFFTITIESNEIVKKSITFIGMLITSFCVFLKFGLFFEEWSKFILHSKNIIRRIFSFWKCFNFAYFII